MLVSSQISSPRVQGRGVLWFQRRFPSSACSEPRVLGVWVCGCVCVSPVSAGPCHLVLGPGQPREGRLAR
ncbi:hypothetical protein RRG08_031159 [Elysia crispata]|uniref:Uncharacterized protein n=1 Tax=Elysia crispata TaxID=231223 RepID=A0AAE0ZGJ6_9GAST|nr:hypothetical protein RRG08_031159 [Elysia crispata]